MIQSVIVFLLCLAIGMGRAALFMQATQQVKPPQQKQDSSPPKQVRYLPANCHNSDTSISFYLANVE